MHAPNLGLICSLFLSTYFLILTFTEECQPGTWSRTGYEPCGLCPLNFYQDENNAVMCKECATDKGTNHTGSSTEADCITPSGK